MFVCLPFNPMTFDDVKDCYPTWCSPVAACRVHAIRKTGLPFPAKTTKIVITLEEV